MNKKSRERVPHNNGIQNKRSQKVTNFFCGFKDPFVHNGLFIHNKETRKIAAVDPPSRTHVTVLVLGVYMYNDVQLYNWGENMLMYNALL